MVNMATYEQLIMTVIKVDLRKIFCSLCNNPIALVLYLLWCSNVIENLVLNQEATLCTFVLLFNSLCYY